MMRGKMGWDAKKETFFGECPLMACACFAKRSVFGNKVYGFSHMWSVHLHLPCTTTRHCAAAASNFGLTQKYTLWFQIGNLPFNSGHSGQVNSGVTHREKGIVEWISIHFSEDEGPYFDCGHAVRILPSFFPPKTAPKSKAQRASLGQGS